MNRKPDPEMVDDLNPEWTRRDFLEAVSFQELPADIRETINSAIGTPAEMEPVSLFLSSDIVARFRASGPNWRDRVDAALADWLRTNSPDDLPGGTADRTP